MRSYTTVFSKSCASTVIYPCRPSEPSSTNRLSDDIEEGDNDMILPSFGISSQENLSPIKLRFVPETTPASSTSPDVYLPNKASDDHAVQVEPTQNIDYLAQEWREDDIWASWSYVVKRRKALPNCYRLENASWRQWMKTKQQLKTVSPESLNWLKDCDVTWLYGPLQVGLRDLTAVTAPPDHQTHSSSFIGAKKSNLKKASASAVSLKRSHSQQSLLQPAGEIIHTQQISIPAGGRLAFKRQPSHFELGPHSLRAASSVIPYLVGKERVCARSRTSSQQSDKTTPSEKKHVEFETVVTQVCAVISDENIHEESDEVILKPGEGDDGGLMVAPVRCSRPLSPQRSVSGDNKTSVTLVPTCLKPPSPELVELQQDLCAGARSLASSSSQETLRPLRPSHIFLLDDDAEVRDEPWQALSYDAQYEPEARSGLCRTESGMFILYDEDEGPPQESIFGQALNVINIYKDIMYVVWNAGWH